LTTEEIQILRQARELIVKGWTQEALARTRDGRSVSMDSPLAARFCLIGAIQRANFDSAPYGGKLMYDHCVDYVRRIIFATTSQVTSCVIFNDEIAKSKQDVIKLLDRAIAEAA
jgi:hypothetical protein